MLNFIICKVVMNDFEKGSYILPSNARDSLIKIIHFDKNNNRGSLVKSTNFILHCHLKKHTVVIKKKKYIYIYIYTHTLFLNNRRHIGSLPLQIGNKNHSHASSS